MYQPIITGRKTVSFPIDPKLGEYSGKSIPIDYYHSNDTTTLKAVHCSPMSEPVKKFVLDQLDLPKI